MKKITLFFSFLMIAFAVSAQSVFINEIHYDNSGGDLNEGVEIAGPAGTNLAGWTLEFYNGSNGDLYNSIALFGTIDDEGASGYGALSYPLAGIQNGGAPEGDGIALIDASSNIVQFLSYEGSFTADADNGGIAGAAGASTTDIGVAESGGTTSTQSMQLQGTGELYTDFTWAADIAQSFEDINAGQTFMAPVPPTPGQFTECATDNPQAIGDFTPVTSVVTLTQPGVVGAMTDQNTFDNVLVDLQHDRAGDLVMTLTSPAGTVLELSSNNGDVDGLDTQADLLFVDGEPNVTTWVGGAPAATGYEAEGGSLMATFAGETIAGDWTLTIEDGGLGDEGDLFDFCLTMTNNGVVGTPPTISCPADIVVNSDEDVAGDCVAAVVFANAAAIDAEDGPIATTQTAGPTSGSDFPVGDTDVTFEATDSDGNTVSCTFTVTVIDNEDPVAVCQDITVTLDEFGMASITEADIDGGSTDNCPAFTLTASQLTFGCSDVGDVVVTLTITDASGNTDTCDATVTVVDDIAPVIVCEGEAGSAVYSNAPGATIDTNPGDVVVTDIINVPDDVVLDDVNVSLDISHAWAGDLDITLTSPAGTVVQLKNSDGCSSADIIATLDDDGAVSIDATCDAGPAVSGVVAPSSPLAAFNGESSLGDWTITITDTFPGLDGGALNEWGLILSSPDLALPALDVVLDVDGLATVNASDLLVSADDACGVNVSVGGGGAPVSLTTTFGSDNGLDGNMFDLNVLNDVTINSFDINMNAGTTDDVEVYFKTGTHVGFETDASAWTLLGTATGITSNGDDVATPLNLNLGQVVLAGETVAFYVTTLTAGVNYTNGSTAGAVFASDANIEFLEGAGNAYPFGTNFSPRVFNGNIVYSEGTGSSSTIDFTCAEVGLNDVEVTVTDPSGNESTCTAQVNVIDDIAPVLVCQDIDLEIGPDGTATLDPMDLIDMTNSIEACGYDIVTADITDFDCSNVGTPVLVTIFAADPSGNIASCSAMVTATDTTGPTITCPDDVNVSPEPNGVYTLEDFTAAAVAVDNCTDPVTIITQDPAAGAPLGVGTYTITISAEDGLGNISTCDFTLTVDQIQGVNDTAFDAAITMFPNPADNVVTIANKSNIALENAAIYDINGKLVSTIDLAGMQSERTINVAALASGVYVVQITGENAVTTKRLIKK